MLIRRLIVIALLTGNIFGQVKVSKPKMISKFYKGDSYEAFDNALTKVAGHIQNGDKLIIRLCTREKFPEALALSAGRPATTILRNAKNYDINFDDIYFATYSKCAFSGNRTPAPVEFWLVPMNSMLESDSKIPATNLKINEYRYSDDLNQFKKDLRSFNRYLSENPAAHGYLLGYSRSTRAKKLMKNIEFAKLYLRNAGLSDRFKIFLQQWSGIEDNDVDLGFPYLLEIEITPQ